MRRSPLSMMGPRRASPGGPVRPGFAGRALAVLAFGIAFGYVEAAVVMYLQGALGTASAPLFPLRPASGENGRLIAVEVGRELATLVMLASVGWVAGRRGLERLAWAAIAFGAWDLAYYGWLWVFSGWPPSLGTWDILFLVPVPWVAPVSAPMAVSVALVVVGLAAGMHLDADAVIQLRRWQVVGGLAGGVLVLTSFLLNAPSVLAGGVPQDFAWPVFVAGMLVAGSAAATSLADNRGA